MMMVVPDTDMCDVCECARRVNGLMHAWACLRLGTWLHIRVKWGLYLRVELNSGLGVVRPASLAWSRRSATCDEDGAEQWSGGLVGRWVGQVINQV